MPDAEHPERDEGPAPHGQHPGLVDAAGHKRRDRERERHGEADVAGVEDRRVKRHQRMVLQQRVGAGTVESVIAPLTPRGTGLAGPSTSMKKNAHDHEHHDQRPAEDGVARVVCGAAARARRGTPASTSTHNRIEPSSADHAGCELCRAAASSGCRCRPRTAARSRGAAAQPPSHAKPTTAAATTPHTHVQLARSSRRAVARARLTRKTMPPHAARKPEQQLRCGRRRAVTA